MTRETESHRSGFTKFDNYFLDHVMPRVSGAEWKILCAVVRETIGWQRADAEISIKRFIQLTGLASEALCLGIKRINKRGVIRRESRQIGRQRTFRFSAVPRANLKSLEPEPDTQQEALPFASDFGIRNANRSELISEPEMPTGVSDFGIRNVNASVLISVKKEDLKTHTQRESPVAQTGVCDDRIIDRSRYKAYAKAQPRIEDPNAWTTAAARTREWDDDVLEWEEAQRELAASRAREARNQSSAEAPQVETAPPNWPGTPLEAVINAASEKLDDAAVNNWFTCLRFEGVTGAGVILASAPSTVEHDWLLAHHRSLLNHPDGRPVRLVRRGEGQAADLERRTKRAAG